jgi:hypothetical protein
MIDLTASDRTAAQPCQQLEALPDTVHLTGEIIRGWRQCGYRITEQRVAGWLYLLARNHRESAVYKVAGPVFDGPHVHYHDLRIA